MSAIKSLHIIEPTLRDQTGHCFSLLRDLLAAVSNESLEFHIWMHKKAQVLFEGNASIREHRFREHRFFSRRLRRFQAFLLYRKLLKTQQRFLVSTATSTDLLLLDWAARTLQEDAMNKTGLVWLYVHWFYPTEKKLKRLRVIAKKYPGMAILCPTDSVKRVFEAAGFARVQIVPYPSGISARQVLASEHNQPFEKLLYAGAARIDKGFPIVVDLVALLKEQKTKIPITLQCSVTHKGKHGEEIQRAIQRLYALQYEALTTQSDTLEDTDYQAMFAGSIVLQPYDASSFADRISGVTLDALKAASPVIVPADTWMARQVSRFNAGVVLKNVCDANELFAGIQTILSDWDGFAQRAQKAGETLSREHDPAKFVKLLLEH